MSTPSLLAAYTHCKRRAWLQTNRIRDGLDRARSRWYDSRDLIGDEALYEVELPSGSRLDAWIPEEGLAIEFKAGVPDEADLIQVIALYEELWMAGVSGFSFQIWYSSRYAKEARVLAAKHEYGTAQVAPGMIALRVDEPESTHLDVLAQLRLDVGLMDGSTPPAPYGMLSKQCSHCTYHDICHI